EVGVHRAGEVVVSEHCGGPGEDTVGELRRFVHQGIVLDLAAVAHPYAGADVRTATDDAVRAEHAVLAHLSEVPHHGSIADPRRLGDVCRVDDAYVSTLGSTLHGIDTIS